MSLALYGIAVLVAGAVFFAAVTAIGLIRLPDVYTRAHAASKAETLAAGLAFAAAVVVFGQDLASLKTGLLLLFMFLTNPTAAHAITRAAHEQDIPPWTREEADP